jgi:hypothetical protein
MGPAPHQLPHQAPVSTPRARRAEDDQIEDAVILDETPDAALPATPPPADSALVFSPALIRKGGRYELIVSREGRGRVAWGFWAGVAAAVAFVGLVMRAGATGFHDLKLLVTAVALMALSAGMFKWAPTNTLERVRTLSIDPTARQLVWHQDGPLSEAPQDGPGVSMAFDEVSEIVFGMVFVPMDSAHPDARIHAFTLLVRDGRDQLIPVIAACPSKGELFELAKLLSHYTEAPITQVGAGVRNDA